MFRLTPAAAEDAEDIASHIAEDNAQASIRRFEQFRTQCRNLGSMPCMGSPRYDARPGLRLWTLGSYLILYHEVEGGV